MPQQNKDLQYFKDIPGYEGIYRTAPNGIIESIKRQGANAKVLTPSANSRNYFIVSLTKNNKRKSFLLHRLVALVFIPNPENKPEVNHIYGIKANNSVDNLEWVTPSENVKHAYSIGLKKISNISGEKNTQSKISNEDANLIRLKYEKNIYTVKMLAQEYQVNLSTIWNVLKNKTYREKGGEDER